MLSDKTSVRQKNKCTPWLYHQTARICWGMFRTAVDEDSPERKQYWRKVYAKKTCI